MKRIQTFIIVIMSFCCFVSVYAHAAEQNADRDLTEESIWDLFMLASEANDWCDGDSDMISEDETRGLTRIQCPDGVSPYIEDYTGTVSTKKERFELVPFEECCTKAKMKSYLMRFFTEEKADEIMDKDMPFREGDNGYLYIFHRGIRWLPGIYISEPSDHEIVSKTDKRIVLRVFPLKSEYPDEYYDYVLEKNADGNWIFTNYINFRYIIDQDNPDTPDAPVIAVCVFALSSAAAAVLVKKKHN